MKKLLVALSFLFVSVASATTVNIDWLMDGQTYAQTTCETGGNFSLPSPTPTKYGYHFVGWQQNDAIGSWSQSGTPTPDNPIYPTFAQYGNTVLRALGSGNNFVADSYDATTGKITRRVGVKVLDGTENWTIALPSNIKADATCGYIILNDGLRTIHTNLLSNCFTPNINGIWEQTGYPNTMQARSNAQGSQLLLNIRNDVLGITDYTQETTSFAVTKIKQFLADQYAAGTPVTVYYPLAEPVEENYNAQ